MTRKYLLAPLISFYLLYILLIGVFGPQGLAVNRILRSYLPLLEQTAEREEERNAAVLAERNRIETDYGRIMEEAYRYGYIRENEFRIILDLYRDQGYAEQLKGAEIPQRPDPRLPVLDQRQAAAAAAAAAAVLTGILGFVDFSRRRRTRSGGKGD